MNHLHAFTPHPSLLLLYCTLCGETKSLAAADDATPEARHSVPRTPRRRRTSNEPTAEDAAAAAEAELARRVQELPIGEHLDDSIAALIAQANERRDYEPVPVAEDDRIGTGTGL